jgi:hypothetical protein
MAENSQDIVNSHDGTEVVWITGIPRIILGKPSTPEGLWPESEVMGKDYFEQLVNVDEDHPNADHGHLWAGVEFAIADVSRIRTSETVFDIQTEFPADLASILGQTIEIVDCSQAGKESLFDGFGGSGDPAGYVYGFAGCLFSAPSTPVEIALPASYLAGLEAGNIGKPDDTMTIIHAGEKVYFGGDILNSLGVRSQIVPEGGILDTLTASDLDGFSLTVRDLVSPLSDSRISYMYWQYRYSFKKKYGRFIDSAISLHDMHSKLNNGDISWADSL